MHSKILRDRHHFNVVLIDLITPKYGSCLELGGSDQIWDNTRNFQLPENIKLHLELEVPPKFDTKGFN